MICKAKDLLSDYHINGWNVDPEDVFEIEYVNAKQFLCPERLDLICKLVYIDCKVKNKNLRFAKELYTEHIRAFSNGSFSEPGDDNKNSIEQYLKTFDALIDSLPKNGIAHTKSVVGVSEDGVILDGSHRTAVAIYFDIPLPIIRVPKKCYVYDYEFFYARGLQKKYLDYITYQYIQFADDVFVACLWPLADDQSKKQLAEQLMLDCAKIFYKKDIRLTYHGLNQFMIHTYGLGRPNDSWAGSEDDGFKGIVEKARACYKETGITTVYVLSHSTLEKMMDLKQKIRDVYGVRNHSVHITDTKQEAIYLGQVAFNNNSIDLLNNGDPFRFPAFVKKIKVFRNALIEHHCNFEDYAVDACSILAIYGLNDANKIDYLTVATDKLTPSHVFENHTSESKHYIPSCEELIYNPENYLFFRGMKYVSLSNVKSMKKNRNEKKDKADLKLLRRLKLRTIKNLPKKWRREYIHEKIKNKYKNNFIFGLLLAIYRFIRVKILKQQIH